MPADEIEQEEVTVPASADEIEEEEKTAMELEEIEGEMMAAEAEDKEMLAEAEAETDEALSLDTERLMKERKGGWRNSPPCASWHALLMLKPKPGQAISCGCSAVDTTLSGIHTLM